MQRAPSSKVQPMSLPIDLQRLAVSKTPAWQD
jgi:hypothetical protein